MYCIVAKMKRNKVTKARKKTDTKKSQNVLSLIERKLVFVYNHDKVALKAAVNCLLGKETKGGTITVFALNPPPQFYVKSFDLVCKLTNL